MLTSTSGVFALAATSPTFWHPATKDSVLVIATGVVENWEQAALTPTKSVRARAVAKDLFMQTSCLKTSKLAESLLSRDFCYGDAHAGFGWTARAGNALPRGTKETIRDSTGAMPHVNGREKSERM
jgi:hypothetical protein